MNTSHKHVVLFKEKESNRLRLVENFGTYWATFVTRPMLRTLSASESHFLTLQTRALLIVSLSYGLHF